MAAGKSRAAEAVAERLGLGVIDTDDLLERELGEPIASFFEREGEAEFRRREERLVVSVLNALAGQVGGPSSVVALGGGAVESERVRAALAEHMPVWCDVDEEVAWQRAAGSDRPLAADRGEFSARFARRRPLYESLARAILPSQARDAAHAAAPWLAAMQGAPGVSMAWAEAESGAYPAAVGEGAIGLLESAREAAPEDLPARTFCVADEAVLERHGRLLPRCETTITVEGAESSKTISEAERVLSELAAAGARRDDCVLAFGGGVVGDLAGFCAATYQRGVPLVQAPTTLVAQVDSAYGGKTGVDLPAAKNYVGAYHQPIAVLADSAVLKTLPAEELAAGFVEVLKTGLIAGGRLWDRVRHADDLDRGTLGELIFECARTKIAVVADDERDAGERSSTWGTPWATRSRLRPATRATGTARRWDWASWRHCASQGPTICATRSRACSLLTASPSRWILRSRSAGSSTPSVETRSGPARGSASSCSSGPASCAGASRWSRVGSAPPWRS
jgi:shikimate kinase